MFLISYTAQSYGQYYIITPVADCINIGYFIQRIEHYSNKKPLHFEPTTPFSDRNPKIHVPTIIEVVQLLIFLAQILRLAFLFLAIRKHSKRKFVIDLF